MSVDGIGHFGAQNWDIRLTFHGRSGSALDLLIHSKDGSSVGRDDRCAPGHLLAISPSLNGQIHPTDQGSAALPSFFLGIMSSRLAQSSPAGHAALQQPDHHYVQDTAVSVNIGGVGENVEVDVSW